MKILNRITVSFGAFFGLAVFGAFMTFNTANVEVIPHQETTKFSLPVEVTGFTGGIDSVMWSCVNIDSCS